LLTINFSLL